jgi:serine/threonine protein kinase
MMVEESLFAAALERTFADERQAFLEEACAGDAALRERVERLLGAHRRAHGILDRPAELTVLPEVTAWRRPGGARSVERAGTVVAGRYTLLKEIGEGGMGTVWLAAQTRPVRRKVALKIIKPGMGCRRVIARFEAERRVLAMMDHPNIARVLDAGTMRGGPPYFVMELVEGVPITEYCDAHHLTPRARLELFIPVCHAVQHAHQKGIIHRDLKPSNVLVARYDNEPVPKVIDFGVAKATGQNPAERTTFTQDGQLVGTLEYMSPEQATLNAPEIDTRSDIYTLGVLLYELLTGSRPFERLGLSEILVDEFLRIIREDEPQTPSKRLATTERLPGIAARRGTEPARLGLLVKGDLDWIVMKALEKDRARRYETAAGLAKDLQHHLDDEPVQARPPSLRYRMGKFVRRHKGPVLAAFAIVLALVGGIIVGFTCSTWGQGSNFIAGKCPHSSARWRFSPRRQAGGWVLRCARHIRVRRGERGTLQGPARGGNERTGRRLASGRCAPRRCGFRPAHSDLERRREAQGGYPRGARVCFLRRRGGRARQPPRRSCRRKRGIRPDVFRRSTSHGVMTSTTDQCRAGGQGGDHDRYPSWRDARRRRGRHGHGTS